MTPGKETYLADVETAWCPGCGNFPIRLALAQALALLAYLFTAETQRTQRTDP
jgi:pyruvate/2-oxoacid:ferredoxin oxidoreductase beta subunit